MGPDDFIGLDPPRDSEHKGEENGLHKSNPDSDEAGCGTSTSQLKEVISDGVNLETFADNDERQEEQQVQDMDLEDDSTQEQPILEESIGLVESVVTVEKLHNVKHEKASDNGCSLPVSDATTENLLIDESPIKGVKRARTAYADQEPCVRVVYNSLTSESKKKLMEVMQQWSEWHAQCNSSSDVLAKEALEYGEETYFPALHVGTEKTSAVSFWVDNLERKEDIANLPLDTCSIPFYDRGCTLGSTSLGDSATSERIGTLEASRCFNCGSYSHALKECPKPRDNAAINSARKQHTSKRNQTPGSRGSVRYYQKVQGKFDDLKAGVLGPETRECLGIGEHDPPPWLHRMRQLGYPPGYLDEVEDEDEPSGITIFGDEETKTDYEDGELPEKGEPVPTEKKMTVEFPGINAPIPENADHHRWAQASVPASLFRNPSHRPNHLTDIHKGQCPEHQRNDGPTGTEHRSGSGPGYRSSDHQRGHHPEHQRNEGSSSSYRSSDSHRDHYPGHLRTIAPPGTEHGPGSSSIYSPRFQYDHNNLPPSISRSPNLGRSLSDRGWRSPIRYEGSPLVHSPHSPHPSVARQSPSHQYHSPAARPDHWTHDNPYSASPDVSSQQQAGRERHDQQQNHRRHHRN
ncbi:zinc finger CCHC domain-containing protein 8-like isoform X1 [Iris pallida]|uniref:Zinc finger CCHC domain-containing protein 8-like isoform X1 n=1 Tax=Iris pallida TaxID=29817 RepID=A0AAX6DLK1_IRIPA|nr:zinc finger CCHC domain-containing protein 8-like isoform X1 [Iris pallida]